MEDIEYPEVETINEISEIIKHNQQMNNEAYNIWLSLINEINTETNNDRLKDYGYWDREIKNIYIWNQLPQSYDPMTQLLRKSLYFKNNLNNLVSLKNINELEEFMVEEWENIPETVLINLSKSMRRRCELIIENNGERIPY